MVEIIVDSMEKLKKESRTEVINACRDFMKKTGCTEDEVRWRYNGGRIEVGKIPYSKILYKTTCHKCGKRNWAEGDEPMPDCVDCGTKLKKYEEDDK